MKKMFPYDEYKIDILCFGYKSEKNKDDIFML